MRLRHSFFVLFFTSVTLIPFTLLPAQDSFEECTAGVACGRATADGRPLLWKTRDASALNNEVIWNTSGTYHFVSVISAGQPGSSWMGVNEKGFAIINTQSSDLPRGTAGPGNGLFMAQALRECATVAAFEQLLDETNVTGRRTQTNYGVIDATGAAAFYETAGNQYWKYDAEETGNGYVLRTNFAYNGKRTAGQEPYSMDRFRRTTALMKEFYATDKIELKEILRVQVRNFGDQSGDEVEIPFKRSWGGHTYGYFPNSSSICRNSSVSLSVIQGVLPGEPPALSTMWTILGQPATYAPFGVEDRPSGRSRPLYLDTFMLRDEYGGGIWSVLFPAEDAILSEAEKALTRWRRQMPPASEMLDLESRLAKKALAATRAAYQLLIINP